jgi:glutamine cyclotransferase
LAYLDGVLRVGSLIRAVLFAAAAGCGAPGLTPGGVQNLTVEVVVERPHDPTAYTQGLVFNGETLYESTGLYGESTLREVDRVNGQVKRSASLDDTMFGEGIAVADDTIVQLTWREHTALVYRLPDLAQVGTFTYDTEGWGLCYDGARFIMSDGTDRLYFRDRATFDLIGSVPVHRPDGPVTGLNELECVEGEVYANVYQTLTIVRIEPQSGVVTAVIDAIDIRPDGDDVGVMNGIAHDADAGTFLLTGKNWPTVFETRFIADD